MVVRCGEMLGHINTCQGRLSMPLDVACTEEESGGGGLACDVAYTVTVNALSLSLGGGGELPSLSALTPCASTSR